MILWLFIECVFVTSSNSCQCLIIVACTRSLLGTMPGRQRRQRHSFPATQAEYTINQGFTIQKGNVVHFNRPIKGGSAMVDSKIFKQCRSGAVLSAAGSNDRRRRLCTSATAARTDLN